MMMGNRGTRGGDERDAFSRRARRLIGWHRCELRALKRAFAKRTRKLAASRARCEVCRP